jgi:hypothetical protein
MYQSVNFFKHNYNCKISVCISACILKNIRYGSVYCGESISKDIKIFSSFIISIKQI